MEPVFTHLGVLVNPPGKEMLVGLISSEVFLDKDLPRSFLNREAESFDEGFQVQLYCRRNDRLCIQVNTDVNSDPGTTLQLINASLDANCRIWKEIAGLSIGPGKILVSTVTAIPGSQHRTAWKQGSMKQAITHEFNRGGYRWRCPVLTPELVEGLILCPEEKLFLRQLAASTALLMNKNEALKALRESGIAVPRTYFMDRHSYEAVLEELPRNLNYVFKPAGGAAGVGVFPEGAGGASPEKIKAHIHDLNQGKLLPREFQVQEFVKGQHWGITYLLLPDRKWKILQVHRQLMGTDHRFTGAVWTRTFQEEKTAFAEQLIQQWIGASPTACLGIFSLDLIGDQVIEINPRITGTSSVYHVLSHEKEIVKRPAGIHTIHLSTRIKIPVNLVESGRIVEMIRQLEASSQVKILPQGINPFGYSRVLFINDNDAMQVQREFIEQIGLNGQH